MKEALDINSLPEACISTILSLTSPIDVCNSSLVSSVFRSSGDSNVVWENFLPHDYKQILLKSVFPVEFSSKKELFVKLQNPIMIDNGSKIFSLEKSTGKIQYTLSARELTVLSGNNPLNWSWKFVSQSRFSEVAVLKSVNKLKIQGRITSSTLSPKTVYGAYLVVKFEEQAYGLDSVPSELLVENGIKVCRGFAYLRGRRDRKKELFEQLFFKNRMQMLRSKVTTEGEERVLQERGDEWMELELGEFYNEGNDREVKMSLMEMNGEQFKGGLVVEGLEVRPKFSL